MVYVYKFMFSLSFCIHMYVNVFPFALKGSIIKFLPFLLLHIQKMQKCFFVKQDLKYL